MEGVHTAEAVIDNGSFGVHKIRFETGRLARQASGSAVVYLDDETMVLSATTVSKHPKENLDFFPLTVDVEERMYAAGRIPGSFFRREGRPSEDAILTCRLIDRPLRPSFVKGLRNEVQIVETIMALHPEHLYDVVAINAASLSTQLSGLPFAGPIGGVRVALIKGQWVGFPTHSQLADATFDMVVAGRVLDDGDVAIMMVEAESTPSTLRLIGSPIAVPSARPRTSSPRAWTPPSRSSRSSARRSSRSPPPRPRRRPSSRSSSITSRTSTRRSRPRPRATWPRPDHPGKQDREARPTGSRRGHREAERAVRGPRERDQRGLPVADQEAGQGPGSSGTASGSTAGVWPTSGSCPPKPAFFPGYTARPCSSAARPRYSASPR